MPRAGRRGPCRPPVHDRGSQPRFLGDFPDRLRAPLVAAGDRRPRQPHQIGRARESRGRARRSPDDTIPWMPATRLVSMAVHAVHLGRLPVAIVVQARAGIATCPGGSSARSRAAEQRRQRRRAPSRRSLRADRRIEAVDRDQPHRHAGETPRSAAGDPRQPARRRRSTTSRAAAPANASTPPPTTTRHDLAGTGGSCAAAPRPAARTASVVIAHRVAEQPG